MSKLQIAEFFYTVQGEGSHTGQPAVFIRLAGCNLRCGAVGRDLDEVDPLEDEPSEGANWICDTIPVWKEAEHTFSPQELVDELHDRGFYESLENGAHIVLTGGEPTLPQHQEAFVEFMEHPHMEAVSPFVEVETNGTIRPGRSFNARVNQYNVSLKLSNSGHPEEDRINPDAIDWHVWHYLETHQVTGKGSVFKFVVGSYEDALEVEEVVDEHNIPRKMVSVMPAGQTQEQLAETYPLVAEIAKENNWRFSPRLHIDVWNVATGV